MLKETDFKWHVRHVNNIPENPIDCYYCIIDYGDGTGKMFVVKPLHAQDTSGLTLPGGHRYFVFYDCLVRPVEPEEQAYPYSLVLYSGYEIRLQTLVAVFDTLDDAKKRAYTQYAHLFGYVLPHVVEDAEQTISKHFVVK